MRECVRLNMKNIYFVQAGNLYGVNAHLPYGVGCIAAYAWNNPVICENYRLGHFTFLRESVEKVVAAFDVPYMVAFSNYVWNFEYHKALAAAVKKRWPDCLILFGGHQVLNESSAQLDEYPFIDFLIHQAGEIPFERLLLALCGDKDFAAVPSLSYRDADGRPLRTQDEPCASCDFPSPYLNGIFEGLFEQYPDILFSMTFETNRGCPYRCAFCDWGTVRHGVLRMPMERVKAEIEWAVQHKIEFVLCADANFGLLKRDDQIVDWLIESKLRTGYPKKFRACLAKDSDETVFRLNQKLSDNGMHNGAALSFQSISQEALDSIGRKNLSLERFRELVELYNEANVPVYTELILGLPGETFDSYTRGIGEVLNAGIHGALEIFSCELLVNAEFATKAYREKYGIQSVRVRQYHRHGSPKNEDEIPEYSEFVYATSAMPVEDWVAANLFSASVQGFHCLGLLPYLAVYLHQTQQLPYERFYLDYMTYAKANPATLTGEMLPFFEKRYWALSEGKGESIVYCEPQFGEVTWSLGESLFLRSAYECERFYAELPAFLARYGLDAALVAELIRYQRAMVNLPAVPPPRQSFAYDFPAFFAEAFASRPAELQAKQTTLLFPEQSEEISWADFARDYVWYDRRKGSLLRKGYEVHYE